MKPARYIISAALGVSIFFCTSAVSQMSSGPEPSGSAAVPDGSFEQIVADSGYGSDMVLADITQDVLLNIEEAGAAYFAGGSTGYGSAENQFEMLDEFKYIEDPQTQQSDLKYQSEKISKYSRAEKLLIARVVYAESRGEIFEGQVAVATVVLNRFESGLFGSSIKRIVFAPSQFAITEKYNSESLKAVEAAIERYGEYPDNMFFFQVSKSRIWRNFVYYRRIGNHSFYLSAK